MVALLPVRAAVVRARSLVAARLGGAVRPGSGWRPALALLLAMTLGIAHAQPLADHFVEAWTTRDGLPHSTVHGIGQTADGYLWLASWEGIARYDGRGFRLYRRGDVPGLGDDAVRALHVGATGDLWAGSARGGIVRWHAGHWSALAPVDSLVTDLLDAGDGRLWVGLVRGGVVRIDADGRRRRIDATRGLPDGTVNALARDARGTVWVATSGGLARIEGERALAVADLPAGPVFSLAAMPDGRLLVGTEHGVLVRSAAGAVPLHPGLAGQTATRLWRDRDGTVWIGTNNRGLARVTGPTLEWLGLAQGLPNDRVLALRRDREGSLWVGTNGGLARVRIAPIHTLTRSDGLADDFVRATLVARDGTVWVGGGGGLDRIDPQRRIGHVALATGAGDASVLALAQDAAGDVLAGTFHHGLLRVRAGRVVERMTMAQGLPSNEVRALLPARDGRLWIGTKQGVVVMDGSSQWLLGTAEGLPADFIQALHEGRDGAVWIGTGAGAAVVREGRVRALDLSPSDAQYVYGFLPSADGRAMWLATDRGLVRVDGAGGTPRRVGLEAGLPFEKIFSLTADRHGRLWLTGNEGIARLRMADLERAAATPGGRLEVHLFGRADGMASPQANGGSMPAAALDARGRLWVATAIGVARLDPDTATPPARPLPPITVERFEVDGHPLAASEPGPIAAGDHRIVVRFGTPSLLDARRLRYRYRLDGAGAAWVELGETPEVQLTHLDPGRYRLRLQAYMPGERRTADATVAFALRPAWWQRPEVWVALAGLACLLLWGAYLARVRGLRRTERRLRALVDERTAALQVQTGIAERLARTDALTMLANRRALDQALEQVLDGLADQPVSLLVLDVDGFKPINDLHGHAAGDRALCAVADVLRTHAREHDIPARWGGDEFALLLVGCSAAQAVRIAERIREAVEAIDCAAYAPGLSMSASIGVAGADRRRGQGGLRSLVARADEALYRAKREGRNRVQLAPEPDAVF